MPIRILAVLGLILIIVWRASWRAENVAPPAHDRTYTIEVRAINP